LTIRGGVCTKAVSVTNVKGAGDGVGRTRSVDRMKNDTVASVSVAGTEALVLAVFVVAVRMRATWCVGGFKAVYTNAVFASVGKCAFSAGRCGAETGRVGNGCAVTP
jgi:hypothetical protein